MERKHAGLFDLPAAEHATEGSHGECQIVEPDEPWLWDKAMAVLAPMYGGLHNLPTLPTWERGRPCVEIRIPGDLSTFDFGRLTMLVFGAHEQCVRAEITPCNMQYIRIRFHLRQRTGHLFERHPNLISAVTEWQRRTKEDEHADQEGEAEG